MLLDPARKCARTVNYARGSLGELAGKSASGINLGLEERERTRVRVENCAGNRCASHQDLESLLRQWLPNYAGNLVPMGLRKGFITEGIVLQGLLQTQRIPEDTAEALAEGTVRPTITDGDHLKRSLAARYCRRGVGAHPLSRG